MADTLTVSTRKFSREFAEMKLLARNGVRLRVQEGETIYRFEVEKNPESFLGCMKGAITHQAPAEQLFSTGEAWEADA